ncbi:hypothetical protein MUCCIDRAFT_105230 [Mucor lusitanicus CBS 277.49]|uniref:Uncharacterized protein n=1 Tax=Mucor lusitanicus CBS 277.49 TaxID=747725 RepID=A0A162TZ91_MUCCL|nr:hypothetical protein MUCCIDRAFT_105230 [Mucor lusitanicus CBS 277.49]
MQPPTTPKSKVMQFMELREQLKQLEQTTLKLNDNMDTTIKQVPSICKLTTLQEAMFLSAGRVLNPPPSENTPRQ